MERMGSSLRLVGFALLLAAAGCSSLPVQEMSDARQAIYSARAVGGDHYTPESLHEAERLVAQAVERLADGDYQSARAAARDAKRQAISAREAALAVSSAH